MPLFWALAPDASPPMHSFVKPLITRVVLVDYLDSDRAGDIDTRCSTYATISSCSSHAQFL